MKLRREAWSRLARDLDPQVLDRLTTTISFDQVIPMVEKMFGGGIRGRVVVTID
jgi:acrylyl-CoA reductase (NADPH)